MENAELIGLSSQSVLRRRLDTIANNLANMNTNGYKAKELVFEQYIMSDASHEAFQRRDQDLHYVADPQTIHDFSQGDLITTGNPLDVAVSEDAWFVIETPQGERYTRDGAFKPGADGQLVNEDGFPVLGEGGPINISADDIDISVDQNGTIASVNGELGRLRLVSFQDDNALTPIGNNLFEGLEAQPAIDAIVTQGTLEGSNVKPIAEISQMIEVSRRYQSITNSMQKLDELRRTAVARLGRVDV